MKKVLLLTLLSVVSTTTFASVDLVKKCGSLAEKATEKNAVHGYDKDGFDAYDCELAPNNAVVICEVSASKGDGAAVDTYRAILNKSCTKALRVDLIGEE